MKISEQIITKGTYQHLQLPQFVSVKQYIFIKQGTKKCLLLRFSNDSDFFVNKMEFEVIQLNADGDTIDTTTITTPAMAQAPGTVFSLYDGIIVNDKCVDFEIRFINVYSDEYKYSVINNQITIFYEPEKKPVYERLPNITNKKKILKVRSRKNASYPFAFAMSILTALAALVISSFAFIYMILR